MFKMLDMNLITVSAKAEFMAVLFSMPRLFVYHQENSDKKDFTDVVKVQEILAQVLPHTYAPQTQDSYDNDMGM
ncbi:TPA: hypothetical protein EYP45_00565 [Candidatus Peregrinibacteria bacterium]|nr:hypothetical protein [Candidatus Peregrinibacteria bacterium]